MMLTVLSGFGIGLLLGLTGMGAGSLMAPFLLLVLGLDPVHAVGTDLAFAFLTKIIGTVQHRLQRTVWLRPAFFISLGSVPASFLTSWFVASRATQGPDIEHLLTRVIGSMLVLVSVVVLARSLGWLEHRDSRRERWPHWWQDVLLGILIGGMVGLTSVGSGTLLAAILLVWFVVPPEHLVGLDVLVGAIMAFFGAVSYAYHGFVEWSVLGQLLLGSLPGVVVGARLVPYAPARLLRGLLGLLILWAGVWLLLRAG